MRRNAGAHFGREKEHICLCYDCIHAAPIGTGVHTIIDVRATRQYLAPSRANQSIRVLTTSLSDPCVSTHTHAHPHCKAATTSLPLARRYLLHQSARVRENDQYSTVQHHGVYVTRRLDTVRGRSGVTRGLNLLLGSTYFEVHESDNTGCLDVLLYLRRGCAVRCCCSSLLPSSKQAEYLPTPSRNRKTVIPASVCSTHAAAGVLRT